MGHRDATIIETIHTRVSCRTYSDRQIERDKIRRLLDFLQSNQTCPFGSRIRFILLDLSEVEKNELGKLGTYGVIRGGRYYIAGAVLQAERALEDFGYGMERNILEATSLGLGTCWLGGTFNRAGFASRMHLKENEVVPAVTPVGYPRDQQSLVARIFRLSVGADKRKSWNGLFFDGKPDCPLSKEDAGDYTDALECVRRAPSAANRQPWRVLKEAHRPIFHFLLKRNLGYDRLWSINLQNVDMGIALCHFELAARATGLKGQWVTNLSPVDARGMEYICSWMEIK